MSRQPVDPARRSLPLDEWPAIDLAHWQAAITPVGLFEDGGNAVHWRARTRSTNIQHYGRYLGHLAFRGELDTSLGPAERVTPNLVRVYDAHLAATVAPRTRLSMLVGLKVMMQAMVPARSWLWLQRYCNRVQIVAKPVRDKRARMRPTEDIVTAALAELQRLRAEPVTIETAIAGRDAMMLALLALRPLRVRNFAFLELGRHLRRTEGGWSIEIPAVETKTSEPLGFSFPCVLIACFEHYLTSWRPRFPDADRSMRVWLSKEGVPRSAGFFYPRITRLTRRLFGVPINPHLLRDCAASSLAANFADSVNAAKALLGHRHLHATERWYIQADNLTASRSINEILTALTRKQSK